MQMQFGAATAVAAAASTYSSNLLAQSLVMSITSCQLTFDRLKLTAVMIARIARSGSGVTLGIRSASADFKDLKNFGSAICVTREISEHNSNTGNFP